MNNIPFILNGTQKETASATVLEMQTFILKNIGYSNNLGLHRCPKKWQLSRLGGAESEEDDATSVTFAFGHTVAAGLQTLFLPGKTLADAKLAALMAWNLPLDSELPKKKKSFWYALRAIDLSFFLVEDIKREGWELAFFDGIPGIEFSFVLHLPDGFRYNAHIDLILYHPKRKVYRIEECKTSGFTDVNEATYANSNQALSYAIILDHLTKHQTSYEVNYLVWSCPSMSWTQFPFVKSNLVKAEWIKDILYDCETIKTFLKTGYFPKRGEACYDFFRPCEYFGACGYGDQYLGVQQPEILSKIIEKETQNKAIDPSNKRGYDVEIKLTDLLKDRILELEKRGVGK